MMSEQDRLHRDCRVWLYMIAVLHLLCLILLQQPGADVLPGSLYARQPIVDQAAPPLPVLPRL